MSPSRLSRSVLRIGLFASLALLLAACAPAATPTAVPAKPAATTAPAPTTAPAKPAATTAPAAPAATSAPAKPAATTAPAATAAPAKPAATAASGAPQKVVEFAFGLANVNLLYAGYLIGDELKIFEKHGVKPVLSLTQTSAAAIQALPNQSLALATVTTDSAVLAGAKEKELLLVMPPVLNTPQSLIVNPKIKKVEDLRGKVMGASTPKIADAYTLRTILRQYNLIDEKDYSIQVTGDPAARLEALRKGVVDGGVQIEPQLSQLKAEGFVELVRGTDVPLLAKWPLIYVATSRSWAKANEDTLVRFLRGWLEGHQIVYDPARREEVVKILSNRLKIEEKFVQSAYQSWVVEQKVYNKDGDPRLEGVQVVIESQIDMGSLQAPGPKPADLVDTTYLQKARQR